jgi:hypothetical protein
MTTYLPSCAHETSYSLAHAHSAGVAVLRMHISYHGLDARKEYEKCTFYYGNFCNKIKCYLSIYFPYSQ